MNKFSLLILGTVAVIPMSGCASAGSGMPLFPTAENINARPFFVSAWGGNSRERAAPLDVEVGKPLMQPAPLVVADAATASSSSAAPMPGAGPIKLTPGPVKVEALPPPPAAPAAVGVASGASVAVAAPEVAASTPPAPSAAPAAPVSIAAPTIPATPVPSPVPAVSAQPAPAVVPGAPASAFVSAPVATPVETTAPPSTPAPVPVIASVATSPAGPSSMPAVVPPPAAPEPPAPPPPLPEWTMQRGETLVGKVSAWAVKAGWNPPIRAKADDWLIEVTPPPLSAEFETAIQYLADGFQRATPRPRITLSPASRSILIESVN